MFGEVVDKVEEKSKFNTNFDTRKKCQLTASFANIPIASCWLFLAL